MGPLTILGALDLACPVIAAMVKFRILGPGGQFQTPPPSSGMPLARWISNKIFMEIRSLVIVWLGAPLLVLGGGLSSTEEFKNVMATSLAADTSLVKFS